MSKNKPGRIEITAQEVNHLIERGEKRSFTDQDYVIVLAVIRNYFALHDAYQEKSRTILRFLSWIFGHRTEKAKDVLKEAFGPNDTPFHRAGKEKAQRAWPKWRLLLPGCSESDGASLRLQSGGSMPPLSQRKALPLL